MDCSCESPPTHPHRRCPPPPPRIWRCGPPWPFVPPPPPPPQERWWWRGLAELHGPWNGCMRRLPAAPLGQCLGVHTPLSHGQSLCLPHSRETTVTSSTKAGQTEHKALDASGATQCPAGLYAPPPPLLILQISLSWQRPCVMPVGGWAGGGGGQAAPVGRGTTVPLPPTKNVFPRHLGKQCRQFLRHTYTVRAGGAGGGACGPQFFIIFRNFSQFPATFRHFSRNCFLLVPPFCALVGARCVPCAEALLREASGGLVTASQFSAISRNL